MSPLSWRRARTILRDVCENYLQTDPKCTTGTQHRSQQQSNTKSKRLFLFSCWNIATSVALLAPTIYFYTKDNTNHRQQQHQNSSTLLSFPLTQLIGASIFFCVCIFNIWLVVRYHYTTSHGTDNMKRRMISKFLKEIKDQVFCSAGLGCENNGIDLVGTSLTDIYPVYRLNGNNNNGDASSDDDDTNGYVHSTRQGSWTRVPTLLLVEGDHVALQIGDIAPAKCRRISEENKSSQVFESGNKITLDVSCGETVESLFGQLRKGRTTLNSQDSAGLLRLCNDVRIFEVLESPLETFLREPQHKSKTPQLIRQLSSVRDVLSVVSISVLFVTTAVLLGRYESFSSHISSLLPSPFLAMIGTSPFIGPGCLIVIEALGTARILASCHPVAGLVRMENSPDAVTVFQYFLATMINRLSLQSLSEKLEQISRSIFFLQRRDEVVGSPPMLWVPPASINILEKLGVATTFALIDDELVCEPQAIPQQLLIPSGKGLKLLDLCPTYEDESDNESDDVDSSSMDFRRGRNRSFDEEMNCDSDSDSDDGLMRNHHGTPARRKRRKRLLRKTFRMTTQKVKEEEKQPEVEGDNIGSDLADHEVQFEDPSWWKQLPTLKAIGLSCLLLEQRNENSMKSDDVATRGNEVKSSLAKCKGKSLCNSALVNLVCKERKRMQLISLAQCIGFSTNLNDVGNRESDLTPFIEMNRLHVVNGASLKERLTQHTHTRSSEDSMWWGLLRADSTSVIVKDERFGAYQLMTVGDPKVVTRMCHEAWQGENSTILPLGSHDRSLIIETSENWKNADLDVQCFSYSPISTNFEQRCAENLESTFYLLDNDTRSETVLPMQRDKGSSTEWMMLQNQIFLGILGSLVVPRSETQGLLGTLQDAGVRFVYFSPRNMRRQKEIASQMGIDVAWNCAISLRPLVQGEEDEHRMISNYADWDVNAKLPHGIASVRKHLEEVDNVPLLVSLFTDATKDTTTDMIDIFKVYHEVVIVVGLSHLPINSKIFSTSDLAIGVDVLNECLVKAKEKKLRYDALLPSEVIFASVISSHSCAFRLHGIASLEHMPKILAQGRASLAAATSTSIFFLNGYLSFSLYVFLSVCSVAKTLPFVPILSSAFYLLIVLPLVGFPMTMTDPDKNFMQRVPPKNDVSFSFGKKERNIFCFVSLFKALPLAILPQLLYLIAFGTLMIEHETDLVKLKCSHYVPGYWTTVIRCSGLSDYSGVARDSAVALSLAEFMLLTIVTSSTFVYRTLPIYEDPPWRRNRLWVLSILVAFIFIGVYLFFSIERHTFSSLPWYYYILAVFLMPFLCLFWNEYLKRIEKGVLDRAEKLRRLQFETRLGMWSPK